MQFGYSGDSQQQQQQLQQQPVTPIVVPIMPMVSYEQRMQLRHELLQQRKEYTVRRLREHYPTAPALGFAVLLIACCVLLIVMQVKLATGKRDTAMNGSSGLWSGALGLAFALTIIITAISKSYGFFVLSYVVNMLAIVGFAATAMLNVVAIVSDNDPFFSDTTATTTAITTTTTTTEVPSKRGGDGDPLSPNTLHIVLLVAGAAGFILSLAYVITISCILGKHRRVSATVSGGVLSTAQLVPYGQQVPVPVPMNSYPMTAAQKQQLESMYATQFANPLPSYNY